MKHIITVVFLCVISLITQAQNINGVSTNPQNPVNPPFLPWANIHLGTGFTHDPFLNNFDWRPIDSNGNQIDLIPIAYNTGFNIAEIIPSNNMVPMRNPFNTGLIANNFSYNASILKPKIKDRDFRWEDGWELLYMNLGYTPDMNRIDVKNALNPLDILGPHPVNIPYIVLYNRYKGTIRIFAKAWFNSVMAIRSQKVVTTLRFSTTEFNGLLRHISAYDLALDKPSIIQSVSGPSFNNLDQLSWFISDFQAGFDPCICNRTTNITRIKFEFSALNELNINVTNRGILINKEITDISYLTDNFLNLGNIKNIGPDNYQPASKIYGEMGALLDAYKAVQAKYETKLVNYNSLEGKLKQATIDILKVGVKSTGSLLGAEVAGSLFTNSGLKTFVLKNKTRVGMFSDGLIGIDTNDAVAFAKSITGAAKSILATSFDFLSTTIEDPEKPKAPSPSTATFTETTYKGTITTDNRFSTADLLIPGSLPNSFPNGDPGVNRLNYPAYNEVLGLFALLETPKVEVASKRLTDNKIKFSYAILRPEINTPFFSGVSTQKKQYQIKLKEKLSYRFNHAVNFNFDKTKLYYSYRIKLKNTTPLLHVSNIVTLYANHKLSRSSASDHVITDSSFLFSESFDNKNGERIIIITTPFTEVKNMLNEPFEFLNSASFKYYFYNPRHSRGENLGWLLEFSSIESIELKLMADMYFLNSGSKGQEINTLQTFTYLIYENSGNDNQMPTEQDNTIGNVTFLGQNKNLLKHQSGNVVFDNIMLSPNTLQPYTHTWVNGTEIHIWVENAILKNNISVANGYKAFIHFLGSAVSNPNTQIIPELVLDNLKSEDLYQNPFIYEATDTEVNNFCSSNNGKYRANSSLSKTGLHKPEKPPIDAEEDKNPAFQIYPNPANNYFVLTVNLAESQSAIVTINNISGSLIKKIDLLSISSKEMNIETSTLENGLYFVTLTTSDGYIQTKKLLIVK